MDRYDQCLRFDSEEDAEAVARMGRNYGAAIEREGERLYFPDRITFDYMVYHYKNKARPGSVTIEDAGVPDQGASDKPGGLTP